MSLSQFKTLLNFDFENYRYYYFTIRPHGTVALSDNARDIVKMIEYIEDIMLRSTINVVVYSFELDSKNKLHVHGIAQSLRGLCYKNLYRSWGVHHHFKELMKPKKRPPVDMPPYLPVILYITKKPVGPFIKAFKASPPMEYIKIFAYWPDILNNSE